MSLESIFEFLTNTGFAAFKDSTVLLFGFLPGEVLMIVVACTLLYMGIRKGFEPLLMVPIAFGMLLANLPLGGLMDAPVMAEGKETAGGLFWYLYQGVKMGVYPPLIFLGIGAMTDFGPLIANPSSLLLGAAAQLGIFITFLGAQAFGFSVKEAASIGIIGGADGPTAIYLTARLANHLLAPVSVAAYSYMALVPVIQPPIMKLLTTKEERRIAMGQVRPVAKLEKILFPIVCTLLVGLFLPPAIPLVGMFMLGNLLRESGVTDRLSDTAQNAMINVLTIFLGVTVGATANASHFLSVSTISILALGCAAFAVSTAGGVLLGKLMCWITKGKINPLIGSAGVSAVPMAARVSQLVGQQARPGNYLLMHAMGPNVAGVIGSSVAAGIMLSMLG